MGEQTRQFCGAGGEVGEKTRLLHRWVKNHSPLVTHFPPEPLCLRVQRMCVLLSGPSSPAFLLYLAVAGPQSLVCPCLFSSLPVRPWQLQGRELVASSQSWSILGPELSTFPPSSGDWPNVLSPTPVPSPPYSSFSPLGYTGCDPHPSAS